MLTELPPGQYRMAVALIADTNSRTDSAVAEALGLHLGTVYDHLRRIRLRHREMYQTLITERRRQLAVRHAHALEHAAEHSQKWRNMQSSERHCRFCWPKPVLSFATTEGGQPRFPSLPFISSDGQSGRLSNHRRQW
jgi:hypothetical protein